MAGRPKYEALVRDAMPHRLIRATKWGEFHNWPNRRVMDQISAASRGRYYGLTRETEQAFMPFREAVYRIEGVALVDEVQFFDVAAAIEYLQDGFPGIPASVEEIRKARTDQVRRAQRELWVTIEDWPLPWPSRRMLDTNLLWVHYEPKGASVRVTRKEFWREFRPHFGKMAGQDVVEVRGFMATARRVGRGGAAATRSHGA